MLLEYTPARINMTHLAIIGGTGLSQIDNLEIFDRKTLQTPFGPPSAEFIFGKIHQNTVLFLARHGNPHTLPPHKVNYRANIWALKELGVEQIIAVAAVGGITTEMSPGRIIIPDQLIDYTTSRSNTFFEDNLQQVTHIDFTAPYTEKLRIQLIAAAEKADIDVFPQGVYGATQGPRLETTAEILRLQRDGCDLVGMTGMPEAALARELNLQYAACAVVANWAAGKSDNIITMTEIEKNLEQGMANTIKLVNQFLK
jgi:5'-methylthioinosine phosphorylase